MRKSALWSLRLGFSAEQAEKIEKGGLESFLKASFATPADKAVPAIFDTVPKTPAEYRSLRTGTKTGAPERKELAEKELQAFQDFKAWWIGKMTADEFPLREKMVVFWHNHFVSSYKKVRSSYWTYEHNQVLREHAFGNLRTLVKKAVATNAMVRYLDNEENVNGKLNENLSRELLELFTLGIGHYSEEDIKNGAKGLAGLRISEGGAAYIPRFESQESFTYLGVSGNLKLDGMVDAIFRHPEAPYFITRKLLKWFLYDDPDEKLVRHYGDFLRKSDYELQPFLIKMFLEEYPKETAGQKIKDPLVFLLQLADELHIKKDKGYLMILLLKLLGMDLYNQPNVKGWDGGTAWITAQTYLLRQDITEKVCSGRYPKSVKEDAQTTFAVSVPFDKAATNKKIIQDLSDRVLFRVTPEMQDGFERILKYDFDPNAKSTPETILRLFDAMAKCPEFQLI